MRTRQISGLALLTAATVLLSAGCASDDPGESDDATASESTSTYATALAQLPADTTTFEFRGVASAESRVDAEDEHDPENYLDATAEIGWAASSLLPYLSVMSDSAWDATDIVWEAQALTPPDHLGVRRLADDVDFAAVVDEFEDAGYSGESAAGGTLLTAGVDELSTGDAGRYVQFGLAVLVLPEKQLIVSAPNEGALSAYTDMDKSIADAGTFDGLTAGGANVEYVYAQTDATACNPVANPTGTGSDPPAAAEALAPYEDLGTPSAATLTIAATDDDVTATARLAFDDAAAADADLDVREALLKDGTSLVTGKPFSEYVTVTEASSDDGVETIGLDAGDTPGRLVDMVHQRDAPFFACAPD